MVAAATLYLKLICILLVALVLCTGVVLRIRIKLPVAVVRGMGVLLPADILPVGAGILALAGIIGALNICAEVGVRGAVVSEIS